MEILVIISFCIYIVYNLISLYTFGVPHSLSNTYYLWNGVKQGAGYAFCACLGLMVALLLPSWLEMSAGSPWQFLSFLTCGSLLFVAAAPNFKSIGIESTVHSVAAIFSAICAILWIVFVADLWAIVLLTLMYTLIVAVSHGSLRSCYIYWLETIAFLSLYFSVLLTYCC
jgi:hypothetical protein